VWPDDPDHPDWDRSIWDVPHLINDASGPALFLFLPKDEAGVLSSTIISAMAEERGLVAFDPQVNLMRPCPSNSSPSTGGSGRAHSIEHVSPVIQYWDGRGISASATQPGGCRD
jgi:hypothetical protein